MLKAKRREYREGEYFRTCIALIIGNLGKVFAIKVEWACLFVGLFFSHNFVTIVTHPLSSAKIKIVKENFQDMFL